MHAPGHRHSTHLPPLPWPPYLAQQREVGWQREGQQVLGQRQPNALGRGVHVQHARLHTLVGAAGGGAGNSGWLMGGCLRGALATQGLRASQPK